MERIETINQAIKYLTQKSLRDLYKRVNDLRDIGFDVYIENALSPSANKSRRSASSSLRKQGYTIVPQRESQAGFLYGIKWDIEKIMEIIKKAVVKHSGVNEAFMFNSDPVSVQLGGRFFPPVDIWGMVVDKYEKLLLMDSDQVWHEITTKDVNAYAVLTTLYMHPLTKKLFKNETDTSKVGQL